MSYNFWPPEVPYGIITRQNYLDAAGLMKTGGPVYVFKTPDGWPFNGSSDEEAPVIQINNLDWTGHSDGSSFEDLELSKKNYKDSDIGVLNKFSIWNSILQSIDDISIYGESYSEMASNATKILGRGTILGQNQGFVISLEDNPFDYEWFLPGVMTDYLITKTYSRNSLGGNLVSSDDILAAYQDAWEDAVSYLMSESPGTWLEGYQFPLAFQYWQIIANPSDVKYLEKIRELPVKSDILSDYCGLSNKNGSISWNENKASSATASNFINPNLSSDLDSLWYRLAISEGDNFATEEEISTRGWHPSTRVWGLESTEGRHENGYAGTLSNGNIFASEVPSIKSIAIVPTFVAFPEVYQCLIQQGPAWEYAKSKLRADKARRVDIRKYVFDISCVNLQINKLFLQKLSIASSDTYMSQAIPAEVFPSSGLQYGLINQGTISSGSFSTGGGVALYPINNLTESTTPTVHVKCYNPMDPGIGFAHSFATNAMWVGQDWGLMMSMMVGATMGLGGFAAGTSGGLGPTLFQITFVGLTPSWKTVNSRLVWNPHQPPGGYSTLINITNDGDIKGKVSTIPDNGQQLEPNEEVVITELTSSAGRWGETTTDDSIGTWCLWPGSFTNASGTDNLKVISIGQIDINVKAKTDVSTDDAMCFLEFRFYALDMIRYGQEQTSDILDKISSLNNNRNSSETIDEELGQYEFLTRVYATNSSDGISNLDGPGREFIWKQNETDEDFEDIRSKSNSILTTPLNQNMQNYRILAYIDGFSGDVTTILDKDSTRIFDDDPGIGDKYFSAEQVMLFVNIRAKFTPKSQDFFAGQRPSVTVDIDDTSIKLPAKVYDSSFIGLEQRFYNTFKPPVGGEEILNDLNLFVPPLLADEINNSEFKNYDFGWHGEPDFTKMMQLSPYGDNSGVDYFHVRGVLKTDLSTFSEAKIKEAMALEQFTPFITSQSVIDYSFLSGDPNFYWNLEFTVEKIIFPDFQEDTQIKSGALIAEAFIITSTGEVINIFVDSVSKFEIASDEIDFKLKLGPIISDITFLNSGNIVFRFKFVVDSTGSTDGPCRIRIKKDSFKLIHNGTIGKIKMTGPGGYVKGGKHIAWFRGLNDSPPSYVGTHGMQNYIMDFNSMFGWVGSNTRHIYNALVTSPIFEFPMERKYGWVLEFEGLSPQTIAVALLAGGSKLASEKKNISSTATMNLSTRLLVIDDLLSNIYLVTIPSSDFRAAENLNLALNGDILTADDGALADSSTLSSEGSSKANDAGGTLIALIDKQTEEGHPIVRLLKTDNNQDAYVPWVEINRESS